MRIHDGAYGTLLQHHLHGDETVDDLVLRRPDLVRDSHRAYLDSGARAIQTNTFLVHLRGSARRRRALREAALACARDAAELAGLTEPVEVFATIGPAGDRPRDHWEAIEQVLESGVRTIQFETVTTGAAAAAIIDAWSEVAAGVDDAEVLLGCSVDPRAPTWVDAISAAAPPTFVVGVNCCEGPVGIRGALEAIIAERGTAWAMPSAGLPSAPAAAEGYPFADPARWAAAVAAEVDGLELHALGGCCGTSPDSIAALDLPA